MYKCRLCLNNRKRVLPIYGCENGTTYYVMITSIAKVKIVQNDGLTDQICLACSRKLKEAYEFKISIERCDDILQNTTNLKKLHFNNLSDVKINIELDIKPIVPKEEHFAEHITFETGQDYMYYNDTCIKKVNYCDDQQAKTNKWMASASLTEMFSNFKGDSCDEVASCNDFQSDGDEYNPDADSDYDTPLARRKLKKLKAKNKIMKGSNKENKADCFVRIKPIYMKDLRLLPTYKKKQGPKRAKRYNKKKSVCPYCGILCTNLDTHILRHTGEKKYTCEKCSKSFFTASGLKNHSYTHEKSTFKCDQCIASFFHRTGLKNHMMMHTPEKTHICPVCNKGFKRKSTLSRHILRHNLASKSFKCDLCNMSFHEIFGLRHHMRVHTGERPYKCEICSQPYSYKHDFNRHCFKKHGVFLKRRSVYVMNEEVLKKEQALMKDLMLRAHGIIREGEPVNPFEGPQAAQAFQMAINAIQNKQIPFDFQV